MDKKCSINRSNFKYTCFTLKELKNIAKLYNKKNKKNKIKINQSKKLLYKNIKKRFNCKFDYCLAKKFNFMNIFKPSGPKNNEWLSTIDINNVMKQYEYKYSDFLFLGAVPIDFKKIIKEFSNFQLKNIIHKKIGIIFNLDPHDKPGTHWVSLFIDLNENTICFFDSVGNKPHSEIKKFIRNLSKQKKFTIIINDNEHQLGNNECGVYALYFLISRLNGKSCNYINKKIIRDSEMSKNRLIYFN